MRFLMLLIVAAGCGGGTTRYMVKNEARAALAPPAGKALIVFVRPSNWGGGQNFTVIDGKGGFVGQIPGKGHIRHAAAPGRQRFIIWAENTSVLDADVSAGKTYFVEVPVAMGMWSARSHLYAIHRGGENWDKATEWVEKTNQWDVEPELAKHWQNDKADGIQRQLERADEMWAKYDEEERAKRTLSPDDGR